jgi:hemerythrin-like domain-containing protein
MEARDHGMRVDNPAGEWMRLRAYGNQLIDTHIRLRELLDDLREGIVAQADLGAYCLAFCAAVTRHHTAEDATVFPILAERHPELRAFLAELSRDHQI